jgi:thiamine-phosphate pyrophosphorylase
VIILSKAKDLSFFSTFKQIRATENINRWVLIRPSVSISDVSTQFVTLSSYKKGGAAMPAREPNLSVYVILDGRFTRGRGHLQVLAEAIRGGATCIQLREKDLSAREFYALAGQIREQTEKNDILFIVNDRLDVALAVGADGVHLGQHDLPAKAARHIMPPGMLLGITVRNEQQAVQAQADGASYLGAGSVYATSTKTDTGKPMGLANLSTICRRIAVPVVGIGGINAVNAGDVIGAGAAGVAVVSSVVSAADVAGAAREIASAVAAARCSRPDRPD